MEKRAGAVLAIVLLPTVGNIVRLLSSDYPTSKGLLCSVIMFMGCLAVGGLAFIIEKHMAAFRISVRASLIMLAVLVYAYLLLQLQYVPGEAHLGVDFSARYFFACAIPVLVVTILAGEVKEYRTRRRR